MLRDGEEWIEIPPPLARIMARFIGRFEAKTHFLHFFLGCPSSILPSTAMGFFDCAYTYMMGFCIGSCGGDGCEFNSSSWQEFFFRFFFQGNVGEMIMGERFLANFSKKKNFLRF